VAVRCWSTSLNQVAGRTSLKTVVLPVKPGRSTVFTGSNYVRELMLYRDRCCALRRFFQRTVDSAYSATSVPRGTAASDGELGFAYDGMIAAHGIAAPDEESDEASVVSEGK